MLRFLRVVLGGQIKQLFEWPPAAIAGTPCKPRRTRPPGRKGFTNSPLRLSSRAQPCALRACDPADETSTDRRRGNRPSGNLEQVQQGHVHQLHVDLLHHAGGSAHRRPDPHRRGRRVRAWRAAEEHRQAPAEGRADRALQRQVGDLHPDPHEQRRLHVPGSQDPPVHRLRTAPGHLPQPPAHRPAPRLLRLAAENPELNRRGRWRKTAKNRPALGGLPPQELHRQQHNRSRTSLCASPMAGIRVANSLSSSVAPNPATVADYS
ncbi:hypothetical protein PSEUDO8AS_50240 [Pseudomonas sp. 8AS]|nr:hypothetical protein PSEUDO8AS_50240 [Pseudomonas sp. 8AS]